MYNHQRHFLPPISYDYFHTNASVHNHFTRPQSGLHAVSYKTNIKGFTVRLASLNYRTPIILMSVVNSHLILLKQLMKNFYLAFITDDSNYVTVVYILFFLLQPGFG